MIVLFGVTLLISTISVFLLYVYWKQTFSKYAKQINKFPGPTSVPIMGTMYMYINKTPAQIFTIMVDISKKYRRTYKNWCAHYGILHIITAEDAEILLSNNKHIEKAFVYDFISEWLGRGLLTSTGKKWQHRRKLLTPSFHFNILQKYVETFGDHSQNLVEELKLKCNKNINIIPIISDSALQIICETAMGTTLNVQDKIQKEYFQAVHEISEIVVQRTINPLWYNNFLLNFVPIGWRQNKLINILHNFTKRVIKDRESDFQDINSNINNEDDDVGIKQKKLAMLDLLISAKRNYGSIDDEGIREEVDTFMFEGHDTTTVALTFAIMLLANHKECQEKAVQELNEIFEDSTKRATYDDLQKMHYLELCLKESLRLYPSVAIIGRTIREDLHLTQGTAPAGTIMTVNIFDLHRDQKYFPEPEKFDPNRFLPENVIGRHPFAYLPFSAGARNCIGQKFAFLEMKSMLSAILRNFILEPVDSQDTCEVEIGLVIRSSKEICVKFKPRK